MPNSALIIEDTAMWFNTSEKGRMCLQLIGRLFYFCSSYILLVSFLRYERKNESFKYLNYIYFEIEVFEKRFLIIVVLSSLFRILKPPFIFTADLIFLKTAFYRFI